VPWEFGGRDLDRQFGQVHLRTASLTKPVRHWQEQSFQGRLVGGVEPFADDAVENGPRREDAEAVGGLPGPHTAGRVGGTYTPPRMVTLIEWKMAAAWLLLRSPWQAVWARPLAALALEQLEGGQQVADRTCLPLP
jgi:hypothetical protein